MMGFLFLIFTVTLCWIIYLFLQWTKSVNPAADGTMLDISKTENEASTDSGVCEEVKKAEVEKLKTEVEEVEVERLEPDPDLQKVETGVEELEAQVEKEKTTEAEDLEIEEELEKDSKIELEEEIQQCVENGVRTGLKDSDFLSYDEEVTEDEFDVRVAEVLIKAQESDVAQESVCGEIAGDKADQPIEIGKESEEDHFILIKSIDDTDNIGLGNKIDFSEKKGSILEEKTYTDTIENSETKPLELQRETGSEASGKIEKIIENKNKETEISGEHKEEAVFSEAEKADVEMYEVIEENNSDINKHMQECKFKESEEKVKEDELEDYFMVQSAEVGLESENPAEDITSKESKKNTVPENVKETEVFEKYETELNDRERETDVLGENKNVEIKENMIAKENTDINTRIVKDGETPESSEPREEHSFKKGFSKENDYHDQAEPTTTTDEIKERITFFEDKEELKIFEEEESKILRDLQETEISESSKEDSEILKVNKEEPTISEKNIKETGTKEKENGKFMEKPVRKEIGGNFVNKAKFEKSQENTSLSRGNETVNIDADILKRDLSSELNTQNIESVNKNISFVTHEDIQNVYSKAKENNGDVNSVKKTVIITQEGDYIENFSEEIQISEVMETEVVHQRKIEYTEIADEEEVFYRNVTKVGDEEFVEEYQTKNETFNEKSSTSSVVTNEEVSSNQQTSGTTITKIINLSYTAEECSTENIEIKSFGVDRGDFLPLTDGEQGKKLDIESIKERIIGAKNGSVGKSVSEDTVNETVSVENTQCSVLTSDGKEIKKPVGGVLLFGGEELLSKIKSRKLIIDGYEKGEKPELENGEAWRLSKLSTGIDECQENIITTKSTSCTTSTSSTTSKTTTMITQMKNQNTQTKQEIKQINLQNVFEKADALPDLSAQPANKDASTTQSSESQSEDSLRMTSHNGSEGEIVTEIPTFQSEVPLIHLNKDRNKGPLRRRRPEKMREDV